MSSYHVSVQEAIRRGLKLIAQPSRIMLISAVALPVLLLLLGCSWWSLLLFPVCLFSSILYVSWVTPRWQLWAYANVNDIHQFQRSAELAGLLTRGSHERVSRLLSAHQKETLKTLQERFGGDAVFIDDPSIPGRTEIICAGPSVSGNEPALALNSAGIRTGTEGFFDWGQVVNERIPQVSYNRMRRSGLRGSGGSEYLFRFDHPDGCFEIPLSALRIEMWELDLLLYIYRGRFASGQIPTNVAIN